MMNDNRETTERLDEATSKRLGKLATVPVDTSRLEARLRQAMGPTDAHEQRHAPRRWWGQLASAAAIVLVVGLVGWLMVGGESQAVAAPVELARLHQDMSRGVSNAAEVTSIAAANQALAGQWAQAPQVPQVGEAGVRSCCLQQVKGVKVACVMMEYRGATVTLVVAHGRDLCSADGQSLVRNGRHFMAHEVDGLQMVMAEQNDRWLCVMGELPAEQLLDLAASIEF